MSNIQPKILRDEGSMQLPNASSFHDNRLFFCGKGAVWIFARYLASSVSGAARAVLQKHEEAHKERSFAILLLCLDGHSEQFCNECRLPQAVSSAHTSYLPFPHHVDSFIPL